MSFNYNHIILAGRLTKDPDVRVNKDSSFITFSLAVSRPYKSEISIEGTDFVPIVIWGKLAEIGSQYLKKGCPVLVDGRLQIRSYEKEGETRWFTEVVADNFQILDLGLSGKEQVTTDSESVPVPS